MNNHPKPSAILVGDEIGQLKRIDLKNRNEKKTKKKQSQSSIPSTCLIETIELVQDEQKHPSKSIVSIHPLKHIELSNQYFLVARKDHEIFIYDDQTRDVHPIKYINDNKTQLVGGRCVDDKNIVIGYLDGTIKRINVENDLCFAQYHPNSKAINLLGIDNCGSSETLATSHTETPKKRRRMDVSSTFSLIANSRNANEISNEKQNILTLHKPNWNTNSTYLTCFEVNKDRLAIGGHNSDLKVFDLNTGQTVFNANTKNTDWLGLKQKMWISDIEWLSDNVDNPHLIATCWRTDQVIRIYDCKRSHLPSMEINLKHLNNANNESNPLSFTSLCSLGSLAHHGQAQSALILGTTLGRMFAIDLRTKNTVDHCRVLGSFKGFSGGSVRDIKSIRDNQLSHKIFSCSIDRFVRVHTLTRTTRSLEKKIFIKTRPTCLYPVIEEPRPNISRRKTSKQQPENQNEEDSDDDDDDSDDDDDNDLDDYRD